MKAIASTALTLGLLALAACSSVKTQVDTGPLSARTFAFMPARPKAAPAYADDRAEVHGMIQRAISQNLATKGVRMVPSNGDVIVAYLVIIGNNANTTSLNDYFGYSSDAADLVDKVHAEQAIKNNDRGYFEAGTLVIDFIDPKTSKLLKRASVRAPILRNLPPETRQERIQAIVDDALKNLRFSS